MKTIIKERVMKNRKRAPNHPGGILKRLYLIPMEVKITELAKRIGVSRKTVSKLINEKSAITPDMALRLSRAFNTTPDLWLNLQKKHDLWQAERNSLKWLNIEPFPEQQEMSFLDNTPS